ncbi:MAG: TRAP transporter substrate-binding protein [Burkholderiales bacterium]|jgi:TRAP-type C4-dicarboxylate transport system substrate-binding protein|nr:TRAP transporter substrate-binding protein [Burkholderiales bacterium]MCA3161324.1 TRAP transporter substrate-binding protein [Burkholderiales bacterium]MCA3163396.1 TRAP transporter substrate-binding protein [Burkholderiales bacterium]MCA3165136.1 TRAP transporter substrate-binding protein [Burkholderiales bacterium]MCA3170286.1 TRAP transporter substrate-binding protein [Burkholderiales bacterium]
MKFVQTLAAIALASTASAYAQNVTWDMPTAYPESNPHTVTIRQFAADLEKATNGQVKITVHSGGSLYRAPEIKRAVQSGQAQAGEVIMSLLENENKIFGLDSIPFVATSFADADRMWRAQRPAVERLLAAQGIKLLYAVPWPPQGIFAKREIKSGADFKGLKWRAYNAATSKIAQMFGAQPLTVQAAELSQALATGVVEATMTSAATGVDSKLWENVSHYIPVNAWLPKNMVMVNQKAFDALPKASQDAVVRIAADAEKKGWDRMRAYTDEATSILAKNKMIVAQPSAQLKQDMDKVGDDMLADWLKATGDDGKRIIDAFNKK